MGCKGLLSEGKPSIMDPISCVTPATLLSPLIVCDYDTDIIWVQPESNPIAIVKQKLNYNEVVVEQVLLDTQ